MLFLYTTYLNTNYISIMQTFNVPSIYVPRVHNSVTWEQMKSVFEEVLGEDTVKRVDIVKIKPQEGMKPPPFNRAYVHIKKWLPDLEGVRDKLLAGKSHQEKPKPKPRIILDTETFNMHTLADHLPTSFKDGPPPSPMPASPSKKYKGIKDGVSWADENETASEA